MRSASVSTKNLLLISNDVWLKEVLARQSGRVPEGVPDCVAVLESAVGQDIERGSMSVLSVDVHVSRRGDDGTLETRHPLWHAADFEGELAGMAQRAHQEIKDRLWRLHGRAPDIIYLGGADPLVRIAIEMLVEDQEGSDQTIKIVRLPDTPAISDPRFQSIDAVALGAFPGLDFPCEPERNGNSAGEGRQVTEIEAEEQIELVVTASGPLFEEESEGGT